MDCFAVLGLRPGATHAEVKAAFRARAKVLHPDQGGDAEQFRRLQAAYTDAIAQAGRVADAANRFAPPVRPEAPQPAYTHVVRPMGSKWDRVSEPPWKTPQPAAATTGRSGPVRVAPVAPSKPVMPAAVFAGSVVCAGVGVGAGPPWLMGVGAAGVAVAFWLS
jgi:hypothetical protein